MAAKCFKKCNAKSKRQETPHFPRRLVCASTHRERTQETQKRRTEDFNVENRPKETFYGWCRPLKTAAFAWIDRPLLVLALLRFGEASVSFRSLVLSAGVFGANFFLLSVLTGRVLAGVHKK